MSNTSTRPFAVLALRLGLGILFIAHGLVKLVVFTLPGTAAFFEGVGLPGALAYPVFGLELVAGTLLVAGLFTRWAALALVPIALGATSVHWANGWAFTNANGGWEFPAFLAVTLVTLFLLGEDGSLALARRLPTGAGGSAAQ